MFQQNKQDCAVRIVLMQQETSAGRASEVYHPGDLLTGHVEISCGEHVVKEDIRIHFEGRLVLDASVQSN